MGGVEAKAKANLEEEKGPVMEPPDSGCIQMGDTISALTSSGQPRILIPHRDPFQGRGLAPPGGLQKGIIPCPSDTGWRLPASDTFGWAHLPVSVFMFCSLTLAVWSTSLRKYLLLKVVAITTTSLHARPSISEMQNLSLKACAAHQRGIGAHYFYIILQANRYFPIHISFLS